MKHQPWSNFAGTKYDVVIGTSAIGCAATRQLSNRVFKTLLIDRADIAAGTSSRSSRMLYSGLGYLASDYPVWQIPFRPKDPLQRLRYTAEVMRCRAELVKEMPNHLTKHMFYYPFRKGDQYSPSLVNMGFKLIDSLDGWKVPLAYRKVAREDAEKERELVEGLSEDVKYVGVFEEYMYAWPEHVSVLTPH